VVTGAAGAAAGRLAAGGYWTVYDGIIGPWFLPQFRASTGLGRLHYVILLPPLATCLTRVATRVGHAFADESATRHMHAQFERATIAARHVLRDASTDPQSLADSIVELLDSGQLAIAS
jgi:hypothetical protein